MATAEYARQHYAAHRDEVNARRRARHAISRVGLPDRRRGRRLPADTERDRQRGYLRRYRMKNLELMRAKSRAYFAAHTEIRAIYQSRYRARLAAAPGSYTAREWAEKVALFGGCCAYCGRADRPLHRDHRIPLSRRGSDSIANIVPACQPCNSAKRDSTDLEFIARRA